MSAKRHAIVSVLAFAAAASSQARADRKNLYKETPPPKIDLARSRPLVPPFSAGTLEVLLPQGEPRIGRNFDVMACARTMAKSTATEKALAASLTLKALMPEHAHGMLVVPVRDAGKSAGKDTEASCVLWKGLRFHMPGWWRLEFSLPEGGTRYAFHFEVKHGS